MNTAKQVDALVTELKTAGKSKAEIAWQTALACVSWPYVFGARGEYCTVQNRHRFYSDAHPTIRTKCKGYDSGSCSGCKWYPGSERVRFFDCRGFTYWCLKQVGVPLQGAGATSQWNTETNWKSKGTIDTMPANTLCCLFVQKGKKMEHTGFGFNNETVECSSGVQHFKSRAKKWTHWGVPAGLYDGDIPTPEPTPEPIPTPAKRPTLRRGSKGAYVTELQTDLVKLGYDIGPCGIDGDYGRATKAAVEQLQQKYGLTADGICGPKTWAAIDQALADLNAPAEPMAISYTVQIPGLDLGTAKKFAEAYQGAKIIEGSVAK